MKKIKYIIILILVGILSSSCKKDGGAPIHPLAALSAINAIADQSPVEVNALGAGVIYSNFAQQYYGTGQVYSLSPGSPHVTVVLPADTLHPFFNQNISAVAGGIYSLYFYGQSTSPQSLLLKDNIPAFQDSTSAVRFINLCPDSQPITVNLQGNSPTQTEFTGLAFKQIAAFKDYSAKSAFQANGYSFEVRDAASGNLLTTFTWYFKPFFCNTLVISGLEANSSINVFSVNNY